MKKTIALFIIVIILIIILLNLLYAPTLKTDISTVPKTSQPDILPTGDNLVSEFYETIIRDDTKDESFGNLGDTSISEDSAIDEYGLSINIEVFDTNNNYTIDIDETTPVKITISNSSNYSYTIKDVHIDGLGGMFEDDSFSNITSTNSDNITYNFDRNRLVSSKNSFELGPLQEVSFIFDATWSKAFIYGLAADEYIQFDFSATPIQSETSEDMPAIYFELGVQTYEFSNKIA